MGNKYIESPNKNISNKLSFFMKFIIVVFLTLISCTLFACSEKKPENTDNSSNGSITSIYLNERYAKMYIGDSLKLIATPYPYTADMDIVWASSNPSVASVYNGSVYALSSGEADIKASTLGGKFYDTCHVKILKAPTSIKLNYTYKEIYVGDSLNLTASIYPENDPSLNITWSSSNSSRASVNNGLVYALSPGQVEIKASTLNGDIYGTCILSITLHTATGVRLNYNSITLDKNETAQLKASYIPEYSFPQLLIFKSDDPTIATVDETGKVTAVGKGKTSIKCYLTPEIYAECTVKTAFKLNLNIIGAGTVTIENPDINGLYYHGDGVKLVAKPDALMLVEWYDDSNKLISTNETLFYIILYKDCTLTAKFIIDPAIPPQVNGVYQITTVDDLKWAIKDYEYSYILMNDLSFDNQNIYFKNFSGTFDGNGHTISEIGHFYVTYVLISNLTGTVKNLTLKNFKSNAQLIYKAENAVITNCHILGTLYTDGGGLAYKDSRSNISNCSAKISASYKY